VERVKPLIRGQAVVSTGRGSAGVGLVAVEPEAELATSVLAHKIVDGRYIKDDDARGVVLGKTLAERLRVKPGKKLVVTATAADGEIVNELLRVTGVFETGAEEADSFVLQVPLRVGRRIFRLQDDQATRVGLILEDPDDQGRVQEELVAALQGEAVAVLPWQEVLPDLASYIAVDGGSNYVFQGIILFLIGFTILNTILMSVLERKREFATLLAIGTSPLLLRLQILVESAFLGLFGCVAGLAIGGGLAHHVEVNGLDMSEVFTEGASVAGFSIDPLVRADLTMGLMTWLGVAVFVGTMIIGLYPALKSSRVEIADVLRTH
jgi:ABC-type lipoprotein release transport system permease subunit